MKSSITYLKLIFTILAFSFFVYFAWKSSDVLINIFVNAKLIFIGLSIFLWLLSHFVVSLTTKFILKSVGVTISYPDAFNIHVKNLPARYIPGGIWHSVGRLFDFRSYGMKSSQLTGFFLLEILIAVCLAFIIGAGILFSFHGTNDLVGKIAAFSFVASFFGLLVTPKVLNYKIEIIIKFYIQTIAIFVCHWFLLSLSFILYLLAFPLVLLDNTSLIEVAGVFMFSWGIGFLAIFSPQGIGIFEVIAGNMLNVPLSLGDIAVFLAGFRIISLIADMCLCSMRWFFCNNQVAFR